MPRSSPAIGDRRLPLSHYRAAGLDRGGVGAGVESANYLTGGNGNLEIGTSYYYWITATDDSGQGESIASNVQRAGAVQFFRIARSTIRNRRSCSIGRRTKGRRATTSIAASRTIRLHRIGSSATPEFKDTGLPLGSQVPPTNDYTYDGLNAYYNDELVSYALHGQGFLQNRCRDGYLFQGETTTWTDPVTNHPYAVLNLSPTTGP